MIEIPGDADHPTVKVRRFQNGSVQIYQLNRHLMRHGKTIYLTREQYVLLRNHMIEETDGPI